MKGEKVLVADFVHEYLLQGIIELGWEYDYLPEIEQPEIEDTIGEYVGLVINSKSRANKRIFERGVQLKFVARLGSGMEIIDLVAAKEAGVFVVSAPEGNAQAVAEHALGMILSLFNRLKLSDERVKSFEWKREESRGIELSGKTVGIIGLGNNGSAFARLLSGFQSPIICYDKYKSNFEPEFSFVEKVELENIFEKAEVLSLHIPWNSETNYLVNREFISSMKKPFYLINTSRGGIVNTEALMEGLESGKILGACLDVFENEKPESYSEEEKILYKKLFDYKNIEVSPHVAGWSKESKKKIAKVLINKLEENFT